MTMLLTMPLTVKAQWKDLPLGTNHYDWNVLRTNSQPIAQLWYAAVERFQIFPIWWMYPAQYLTNPPDIVAEMTVTKWYSNLVTNVVSGSITNTYTNKIPITEKITLLHNLYNPALTAFVDHVDVIWTNQNDVVCTNDAYWFLREAETAILDLPYQQIFLYDYAENPGTRPAVGYFVKTNESSNATFDVWFARTNGAGDHPTTFSKTIASIDTGPGTAFADGSAIFRAELGTNYSHIRTNDSWGVEHGRGDGGDLIRFSKFNSSRSVLLAESARTNAGWDFRLIADIRGSVMGYYQFWEKTPFIVGSMMPTLHYVTTNFVPTGMVVSVTGTVATIWENPVEFDNNFTTSKLEQVTITNVYTSLTNYWLYVSNLTTTSSAAWGDSIQATYTNGWNFYNSFEGDVSYRQAHELDNNDLDQRYKVLNALVWANAPGTWTGLRNYWIGQSTNNWFDAITNCQNTQTVTNQVTSLTPRCKVYATTGASTNIWTVEAESIMSYAVGTVYTNGRATNYAHAADYYVSFEAPSTITWDAQGSAYTTNYYCQLVTDMTVTNLYTCFCTSSVTIGTNVFPATLPDEPPADTSTNFGYQVNDLNCLIRFDVPGGFAYTNK